MAEVIGPCSTLPGHKHKLPEGTMCDNHPDRLAVARIQGETDSFGSELNDLCQECVAEIEQHEKENEEEFGMCDWCKGQRQNKDLSPHRDFEEGRAGRVYTVCRSCIQKEYDDLKDDVDVDYDD